MNLQENIHRIKKMMGILTEQDSVTPTQEPTISGLFKMLEQNGYQRYTDQSKVNQDFGNNKFILGKLEFMYGNPEERTFFYKGKTNTFYIDNEDFSKATLIAEDEEMQTPIAADAYISNGQIVRYWKGKSFDEEFLDAC